MFAAQLEPSSPTYGHPDADQLLPSGAIPLDGLVARMRTLEAQNHPIMGEAVSIYAWKKIIEAAERHNAPGEFTAFIGYEYTPTPGNRHLHRNVVFRSSEVPERPFSSGDSDDRLLEVAVGAALRARPLRPLGWSQEA